jgi:hypothetical protein
MDIVAEQKMNSGDPCSAKSWTLMNEAAGERYLGEKSISGKGAAN